ncbi:alpha/beta hydrolase [Kibdelosporangium aridum]|uniref:Alpha/beta hydrolase n=1 Tax=Kibdelosporangium aridum TaxID=2030 RepID=A0A428Z3R6_KIBAR|nr:alpha/beta fold hydrolase [Kibdelosporangium aridum]RSM80865.1 alpha/beta hydrolase [Kibdelosporangium aridum]
MQQVELTSIDGIRLDAAWHQARAQGQRGVVVQAHGINANMTEGGMFVRLAEQLAEADFNVLRFSFRGHGDSGGTQRGMTIAGEMLDLQAAVEHMVGRFRGPLAIVASSFGAVSTSMSLPWLGDRLDRLVLWNPVLDLQRTFVNPELPWGKENFNLDQQKLLVTQGFLMLDGEFEVGRVLFEEFRHYEPLKYLTTSAVHALVVHGDRDSAISYDIARQAAATKPNTEFHTVRGSDHGFDTRQREDEAVAVTAGWLTNNREPV